MSAAQLHFLSWLRKGASSELSVGDDAAAAARTNRGKIQVRWKLTGGELVTSKARVMGPGDVVGIDPGQVIRVDPPDGTPGHELDRFAVIEFRDPALPWMFTPTAASSGGTLTPWCTLVVVCEQAGVGLEPGPRADSTVLRIRAPANPGTELGDPARAHAFAHVQISGAASDELLEKTVIDTPERVLSRILCARQLDSARSYIACLVPTFAAGRDAGLGLEVSPDEPLQYAWAVGDEERTLPVYHSWRFSTGEAGTFLSLASALRGSTAPEGVGQHRLDVSSLAPGITLPASGVLRARGTDDGMAPPAVRAALMRLPRYGHLYADSTITAPEGWSPELNLDPRHRVAAGLGARIVREDQEALAAAAWQQAADVGPANSLVDHGALAREANGRLHAAHLKPLEPAALQQVAEPVLDRLRVRPDSNDAPTAFKNRLLERLDPEQTVATRVASRVQRPRDDRSAQLTPGLVSAVSADGDDKLARMLVSPTFMTPMFGRLAQLAPEHILPGASRLPPDSVTVLETNPGFVAAFMVGLNTELARELVWRGFPLDRRSTFFRHFWDYRGATAGAADIPPFEEWKPSDTLAGVATSPPQLVLVIRGSLLRRYPRTLLYAVRATTKNGQRSPADERAVDAVKEPIFAGALPPDIRFFGFDLSAREARTASDHGWFFVLQEQAVEGRFGRPPGGSLPQEPTTSAAVAEKALRPTARVAVHADDLLPGIPVRYGATVRMRHLLTGRTLHSHAFNYSHPESSGQQQVTGYPAEDDNDLWRIKLPHPQLAAAAVGADVHVSSVASQLSHAVHTAHGLWQPTGDLASRIGRLSGLARAAAAAVGRTLYVFVINDGRVMHAIRGEDSTWKPASYLEGLLTGQLAAVAATAAGSDLHVFTINSERRLGHTTRPGGGSWQQLRDVAGGELDDVADVATTAVGAEVHVGAITRQGSLMHTIRYANGNWQAVHDVAPNAGDLGQVAAAAFAAVGAELHVCALDTSGRLRHAIRRPDGTWQRAALIEGLESVAHVAAAAVESDVHVYVADFEGRVLHAARAASGSWRTASVVGAGLLSGDGDLAWEAIRHGDAVRLEHVLTRKNLHSHAGYPSPVTGQQEVTAFGIDGKGDRGDNWRVEVQHGATWHAGSHVRLIHVDTLAALHSHAGHTHPEWTKEQQEVTAYQHRDDNDLWYVADLRAAVFVSQSLPASMATGQRYDVSVTMRNTGTTTWTSSAAYRLGAVRDDQPWRLARVLLPSLVVPGQEATFQFSVTAPAQRGAAAFQWRMLQEGVEWFGQSSPRVVVSII